MVNNYVMQKCLQRVLHEKKSAYSSLTGSLTLLPIITKIFSCSICYLLLAATRCCAAFSVFRPHILSQRVLHIFHRAIFTVHNLPVIPSLVIKMLWFRIQDESVLLFYLE